MVSAADFKAACERVAQKAGGRVLHVWIAGGGLTYHLAAIELPDRHVAVWCNAFFPLLAFTRLEDRHLYDTIPFIDVAELARPFADEPSFTLLDAAYVNAPVSPDATRELDDHELEDIRYWKPSQIGQVMFNDWD
jgi:hypothetical protein